VAQLDACPPGPGVEATTLAILVLAPAVATAAIIPGYDIAGLKLGDSTARVTALLGKPGELQKNSGGEQNWLYFGKGPVDWVTIQAKGAKKTVEGLETSDPKQRTSKGVGPGSSLAALRKAYPHLTCRKGSLGTTFLSCWILTSVNGQKIPTNFVLAPGKPVSLVDMGVSRLAHSSASSGGHGKTLFVNAAEELARATGLEVLPARAGELEQVAAARPPVPMRREVFYP
jgi:hypothetical protein